MPLPGFLSSLQDKAMAAANSTPLAGHIPGTHGYGRPNSPDATNQPSANQAAAQGGSKSHTLEAIQHQIRAFGQQYATSTTPIQKIITSEKGVAIDFDSVSRDAKAQSKELYTWGLNEEEDIKDVTDRLAYLNFVQGSLASSLAVKLDTARVPLKQLRDAEANLAPRRNIRAGLQTQLGRLEHDQQKGMEKKMAELRDQIKKAESDDAAQEREVDLLKRKAVRESEQFKWEAIREYGEKLVLLSQAANPIIAALPTLPPTPNMPYTGAQSTAAARASLQRALDNYKTGHINLPPQSAASDLSRSDTRSFGESHASELSRMNSETSVNTLPITPPVGSHPLPPVPAAGHTIPTPQAASPPLHAQSPPLNPAALNQAPAPIPHASSQTSADVPAALAADPSKATSPVNIITPTVAETGVPVAAGAGGPGPASGSLKDIKAASADAGPRSGGAPGNSPSAPPFGSPAQSFGGAAGAPKFVSAEEEKRRLQQEYSAVGQTNASAGAPSPVSATGPSSTVAQGHEGAEDEKKRLEREERERVLRGQAAANPDDAGRKDGEDLPPYQDY